MKKLLFSVGKKDFEIQTFRAGGKGGQHQNKTNSGVRIIHKESGVRGESRERRSQHQNKRIAFDRLVNNPKFKLWINKTAKEKIDKQTIEDKIKESVKPKNLKIEIQKNGKWEVFE